jgi:hypothetical protein
MTKTLLNPEEKTSDFGGGFTDGRIYAPVPPVQKAPTPVQTVDASKPVPEAALLDARPDDDTSEDDDDTQTALRIVKTLGVKPLKRKSDKVTFDKDFKPSRHIGNLLQCINKLTNKADAFAAFVQDEEHYDLLLQGAEPDVLLRALKQIQCTDLTGGNPFHGCPCAPKTAHDQEMPCHMQFERLCLGCLTTATSASAMTAAHKRQKTSERSCTSAFKAKWNSWNAKLERKKNGSGGMPPLWGGTVPEQTFFSSTNALCNNCGGGMRSTALSCQTCGRERKWECPTKGCTHVVTVSQMSPCCSECNAPSKKPRLA